MHVAIITAGGAGMFCGSCMQDNTLARALINEGVDVSLIPMYTPIRVDEDDATSTPVFFGGVNVYLDYKYPFWRKIPRVFTRWLDSKWVLKTATKFGVSNDAHELGGLTVAMLEGESGPHRDLVKEFVDYVEGQIKPDVVCFSNTLLVGSVRELKRRFRGPVFCMLQGDDVFLDELTEPHRSAVMRVLTERVQDFDGFVTHTSFYRGYMADYLSLDENRCHVIPLGIDLEHHDGQPRDASDPFIVGYFARIAPEKGLLELANAFLKLRERDPNVVLKAGGHLNAHNVGYLDEVKALFKDMPDAFEYIGSPATHAEKVKFLQSIDVLSVPTKFQEPKGLYVLEALANGVPVVLPKRGSFPELIESTGGGIIVESNSPEHLAEGLEQMIVDRESRMQIAQSGYEGVRKTHTAQQTARAFADVLQQAVGK